nr:uncharacterized protein LOC112547800 isoform X1 [Pelodiscus sinensis]|eukprot:XP_025046686.1 uncharacterized protein LOC112547800 isoform X1 [Pelodiscus sinensis]
MWARPLHCDVPAGSMPPALGDARHLPAVAAPLPQPPPGPLGARLPLLLLHPPAAPARLPSLPGPCQFPAHRLPGHPAGCLPAPHPAGGAVELEKLKDTFSNVIFSLEEKGVAKVPYQVAFPEVAARIQLELAQLKPGYQKDAQVYRCSSCSTVECQLPLDCPAPNPRSLPLPGPAPGGQLPHPPPHAGLAPWHLRLPADRGGRRGSPQILLPQCDFQQPGGRDGPAEHVPGHFAVPRGAGGRRARGTFPPAPGAAGGARLPAQEERGAADGGAGIERHAGHPAAGVSLLGPSSLGTSPPHGPDQWPIWPGTPPLPDLTIGPTHSLVSGGREFPRPPLPPLTKPLVAPNSLLWGGLAQPPRPHWPSGSQLSPAPFPPPSVSTQQ